MQLWHQLKGCQCSSILQRWHIQAFFISRILDCKCNLRQGVPLRALAFLLHCLAKFVPADAVRTFSAPGTRAATNEQLHVTLLCCTHVFVVQDSAADEDEAPRAGAHRPVMPAFGECDLTN